MSPTPPDVAAILAAGASAPPVPQLLWCHACDAYPPMREWPAAPGADLVGADAAGRPRYCRACWEVAYRDAARLARVQSLSALDALARPADAFVRWPFPALDALTGPLAPGTVWYVGAASGSGKTTFATSAIDGWIRQGVRVAVCPLELRDHDWRVQLACVRCDVPPGDVLSGALQIREQAGDRHAADQLDAVRAALRAMSADAREHAALLVNPDARITRAALATVMRGAAEMGYQVVVVDHIDHVGDHAGDDASTGRGAPRSSLDESRAVNYAVMDLAKETGLVAVATSQLNAARLRGTRDRLAKYAPPQTSDLYLHTFKEQTATGILGLFRPTDPEADPELMARARAGDVEPSAVLAPHAMGVVAMKLRNYGAREGSRAFLAVERGRCRERTPDEARAWEGDAHGIRATSTPNGLRLERGGGRRVA